MIALSRALRSTFAILVTSGALAACASEPAMRPSPRVPLPTPSAAPAQPAPQDPAPLVEGDLTVAYENGLRILVKRIPGAELTAAQLYVRGGARNWGEKDAGIEMLALRTAVSGGTRGLDKDAFSKRLTALGSDLGASTTGDYSVIEAKGLTSAFEPTFRMMAAAFLEPALPASEIEVVRQRQLLSIRRDEETPDGRLGLLVQEAVFAGHPYQHRAIGTVASVGTLTAEALHEHLAGLRETSRLTLVVVGDIDAEQVRREARTAFGSLPRGHFVARPLPQPAFPAAKLHMRSAELPTTYVMASFMGPRWNEPEMATAMVAMRILNDRVWEEVRTKRNLSYAPSAGFRMGSEVTRGVLYVTSVDPGAAWKVMADEARRLAASPPARADVDGAKAQLLTANLASNESTNGQASWLGMCDVLSSDHRQARTLLERVQAVTPEQIAAFARQRLQKLQLTVLGDAAKVDRALFEGL